MTQTVSEPAHPLKLHFINRHERMEVDLFADRGGFSPEALGSLKEFLRCFHTNRRHAIDPRLMQIISQISDEFDGAEIDVVSGFRAPPYGVPHSKHFQGHAMDIRVPGVAAKTLRDFVWKRFRGVGVGLYPHQGFVHVDVRDVDTGWVDYSTQGESSKRVSYFSRPAAEPTAQVAMGRGCTLRY